MARRPVSRIQVGVEGDERRGFDGGNIGGDNHHGWTKHHALLYGPLVPTAVDITTQAELRFISDGQTPIIVSKGETCPIGNAKRIPSPRGHGIVASQRLVYVRSPSAFREG